MAARVLVVDDSPVSVKLAVDTLSRAGYAVQYAKDGAAALAEARRSPPDLVLLDVVMPDMDGYAVCRQLRRDPATAQLAVLTLTGHDTVEEKLKGFEAGADDYLTKPFAPAELLARVAVLLRRAAPEPTGTAASLRAKVTAVFSLRGGVGVSSIAANLATGLAQLWSCPVALVDLALTAGQAALMLSITPRTGWSNLARVPAAEIDAPLLESCLLAHSSGAYVLAAPSRPEESDLISPEQVTRVLALLGERFHYIVLDLPHDFRETTLAGLDTCGEVWAVMAPEMASILATTSALGAFEGMGYPREQTRLILNHVFERSGLPRAALESTLNRTFDLVIANAQDALVRAINAGTPTILAGRNDPLTNTLEELCYRSSKDEHLALPPPVPTRMWERVHRRLPQSQRNLGAKVRA